MPEYKNPYASKEFEKHVERHVKACVDRFSPRVEAVFAAADWKSEWFVGILLLTNYANLILSSHGRMASKRNPSVLQKQVHRTIFSTIFIA